MFSKKELILDLLAVISFSNLQMLPVWAETSALSDGRAYFLPDASADPALAAVVTLGILTGLIAGLVSLAIRSRLDFLRRLGAGMLLVSFVNPITLNGYWLFDREWLLQIWALWLGDLTSLLIILGALLVLLFWVGWKWHKRVLRVATIVFATLSPFALLNVASASWLALSLQPSHAKTARPASGAETNSPTRAHQRVVWVLFDELDERALFEARPAWVQLPAFDRLRQTVLVATQVERAGKSTILAVPGMTNGQRVAAANPVAADELALVYANGGRAESWRAGPNLFSMLAAQGVHQAIAGWYHPYCRLFGHLLDQCYVAYLGTTVAAPGAGLGRRIASNIKALNPFYRRRNAVEAARSLLTTGEELVAASELDFVFVHIPLPHQPTIYDAHTSAFTAFNFSRNGYFHNAIAADRFFAALQEAMMTAGEWEGSAVLVTADHSWRGSAELYDGIEGTRIPFMLKMPGQHKGAVFHERINATVTRDLIIAIVTGELRNAGELTLWLQKGSL